jgi:predicted transcriptional regulator
MLSPVEMEVLVDLLVHGDNVPGNIAENTGRHPKSVSKRLPDLEEHGLIRNKGRGVYTLTPDGVAQAQALRGDVNADENADENAA